MRFFLILAKNSYIFIKFLHIMVFSIYINVPCYPSPEVLYMVQVRKTRWMIQEMNVINLKKILWSTSSVNCINILLKKSSLLHTNEPLQRRAMIVLKYRCIQLHIDVPSQLAALYFSCTRMHPMPCMIEPPPL